MRMLAITGTRADWGLLLPVLTLLRDDARFDLRLCVTGQHLDPASPSLDAIRRDGLRKRAEDYATPHVVDEYLRILGVSHPARAGTAS